MLDKFETLHHSMFSEKKGLCAECKTVYKTEKEVWEAYIYQREWDHHLQVLESNQRAAQTTKKKLAGVRAMKMDRVTLRCGRAYIFWEKRRQFMLCSEHIDRNKLKIHLFLMETDHGTSSVCGQGQTIKLQRHFVFQTQNKGSLLWPKMLRQCVREWVSEWGMHCVCDMI